LGHFSQYVAMFYIGIVATRNQWLGSLTWRQGKKLLPLPILMVFVGFPIIYLIKTITGSELPTFSGGWHWQSLFYSIWEQVTGISIIVVLLCYGKEKWNSTSAFLAGLSRSAFAAYIFHPLFLISISLALKKIAIDPAYKLLICIPVAVCATFLFSRFVVRLPVVNKVI
jgi:surface polysaccharide O-acyltransferase-like enzyme